jgi:Carboxypeptidase regulatory-like domain
MRRCLQLTIFLTALATCSITLPAPAGAPAGALSGVVLNSAGIPVAAAQVSWQAADGTSPHAAHSDARGHFRINPVRPGLYEVRAEAAGQWSDWEHNVLVRAGAGSNIILRLLRTSAPSTVPIPKNPRLAEVP